MMLWFAVALRYWPRQFIVLQCCFVGGVSPRASDAIISAISEQILSMMCIISPISFANMSLMYCPGFSASLVGSTDMPPRYGAWHELLFSNCSSLRKFGMWRVCTR